MLKSTSSQPMWKSSFSQEVLRPLEEVCGHPPHLLKRPSLLSFFLHLTSQSKNREFHQLSGGRKAEQEAKYHACNHWGSRSPRRSIRQGESTIGSGEPTGNSTPLITNPQTSEQKQIQIKKGKGSHTTTPTTMQMDHRIHWNERSTFLDIKSKRVQLFNESFHTRIGSKRVGNSLKAKEELRTRMNPSSNLT